MVLDPPKLLPAPGMVESKSVGTFSPLLQQDGQKGLLVDRGVGSPRLVKSASAGAFTFDPKLDSETKVCSCLQKNRHQLSTWFFYYTYQFFTVSRSMSLL